MIVIIDDKIQKIYLFKLTSFSGDVFSSTLKRKENRQMCSVTVVVVVATITHAIEYMICPQQ